MALTQAFNRAAPPDAAPFGNSLPKRVLELIRDEKACNTYTKPRLHPSIHRAISDLNRVGRFGCRKTLAV